MKQGRQGRVVNAYLTCRIEICSSRKTLPNSQGLLSHPTQQAQGMELGFLA
jgi:hypothetical protein